jgi:hypothetical protein
MFFHYPRQFPNGTLNFQIVYLLILCAHRCYGLKKNYLFMEDIFWIPTVSMVKITLSELMIFFLPTNLFGSFGLTFIYL